MLLQGLRCARGKALVRFHKADISAVSAFWTFSISCAIYVLLVEVHHTCFGVGKIQQNQRRAYVEGRQNSIICAHLCKFLSCYLLSVILTLLYVGVSTYLLNGYLDPNECIEFPENLSTTLFKRAVLPTTKFMEDIVLYMYIFKNHGGKRIKVLAWKRKIYGQGHQCCSYLGILVATIKAKQ